VLQLKILTGKMTGAECVARHFPIHIGRAPEVDLRLEEDGVWDWHLSIELSPAEGLIVSAQPDALVCVNNQPIQRARLRNGDLIEAGAVKMQFGLTPTRHRSLRLREVLTWIGFALLCIGQVVLIYWLPD